ncbi:MAG: hypothetical protein ABSD20_06020 [Terriglobales bacterium]|jgi:hypothetical protein
MYRTISSILLACAILPGQKAMTQDVSEQPALKARADLPTPAVPPEQPSKPMWIVPAGTQIPLSLKQAVSTKHAQPGDAIYAQTTFPVVTNEHVVIPAGTYVQGKVDSVKRAGRVKGTAELQFHITTLIYPSGYTLDMAAAIDQVPGSDSSHMKEPGTVKQDSEKGKDLERIGSDAAAGAAIGGTAGAISGGFRGVGIGGLSGIAAGTLIGVLARGSDVHFPVGTVIDVALNHPIAVDPDRTLHAQAMPSYLPAQPPGESEPPIPPTP